MLFIHEIELHFIQNIVLKNQKGIENKLKVVIPDLPPCRDLELPKQEIKKKISLVAYIPFSS